MTRITSMAQARDLLLPGIRAREAHNHRDGEVYVDNITDSLIYHRLGGTHKTLLTKQETAREGWAKLATSRMDLYIGMPPPREGGK